MPPVAIEEVFPQLGSFLYLLCTWNWYRMALSILH
jgi:hypothetical protein